MGGLRQLPAGDLRHHGRSPRWRSRASRPSRASSPRTRSWAPPGWAREGASPLSGASLFGVSGATWMGVFGVLLSVAALLTAYYMGRLMVYTFFGPNRTGEVERGHLHEVGWTMTLPLVVLAVARGGRRLRERGARGADRELVRLRPGRGAPRVAAPGAGGARRTSTPPNAGRAGRAGARRPGRSCWPSRSALRRAAARLGRSSSPRALRTADEEPAYTNGLGRVLYHKWYVDELYEHAGRAAGAGALARLLHA